MRMKMYRLPLLILASLITTVISCRKENEMVVNRNGMPSYQTSEQNICGAIEYDNAATKIRMLEMEQAVQFHIAENADANHRMSSAVIIPVVFHVIYNLATQNISDAQLQSQVDVLNEDFNATNVDLANVPACFQPLIGNAHIQFVLAKRDPNGSSTNGITRTSTSVTSFSSDGSVCYASMGGHDAWPTSQYLNIWVCNKSGAAGYSSYPWSGNPTTDGIIAGYNYIGRTGTFTNNWNYQKGRTITHEVGHWLGLVHIWGDAICGDDLVNDTPTQTSANGSSPAFPHLSSCSPDQNGDMFMNYMDYTYDASRTMFSIAQVTRMNSYLHVTRPGIETSPGGIEPAGSCNVPSGLDATAITSYSAMLSWISTGAISYALKYKPVSSSTWITISSSGTSFAVPGLAPSTTYEYQVQSICSGSPSSYSASSVFSTPAIVLPCNTPTGLSASSINSNGATLNWVYNGALSYMIRYKATTSVNWTAITSSTSFLVVSGLQANTAYEFQVQSVCTTGTSSYSSSCLFTTKKKQGHGQS
jgi:hypothetical protein